MADGQCNCGAVAYHVDAALSDVFVCHCSICRSSTGAGGIAVVVVGNEAFDWTRGFELVKYWPKPGHDWHTNFCSICGSTLPGANDDERMYIPVGTLISGHDNLRVAHHIFVNSKAPWEEIADQGKQHPEEFGG